MLSEYNVTITEDNLLREVALFADRSDVAEEVMRLGSRLEQFEEVVRKEDDGPGRKLEFLTQEMNRETNTIGSKQATSRNFTACCRDQGDYRKNPRNGPKRRIGMS